MMWRQVLNEAYTMVPSCPVVNLHCGLVTTEIALLKGGTRCDPLFDNAHERHQKSIDVKPLDAVYGAYAQALRNHAALKRAEGLIDQAQQLERRADEVDAARRDDARLALPPPKRCDGREDEQTSADAS